MTFLLQNWKLIGLGAALAFALLCWNRWGHWKGEAERWEAQAKAEAVNHRQTKVSYRAAQEAAQQAETARLARVKAEQKEITDDIANDYAARLADARARAERLCKELGKAPDCATSGVSVSRVAGSTGRADEAPGQDGFSLPDRLIATEQALQLQALIDWIGKQAAIDPN